MRSQCGEAQRDFGAAVMCLHQASIMRVAVVGSERSVGAGEKYVRVYKDGRARSSMHQYVGMQECMQHGRCENQAHAQHDSTSGNAMDKSEGKIQ